MRCRGSTLFHADISTTANTPNETDVLALFAKASQLWVVHTRTQNLRAFFAVRAATNLILAISTCLVKRETQSTYENITGITVIFYNL